MTTITNGTNGHPRRTENGRGRSRPVLITGGAGFIGTNLAARYLAEGRPVVIFDNLSRPGVERNLSWLIRNYSPLLRVVQADVTDRAALNAVVQQAACVFHLAAQVAVTTSLQAPREDFRVNAEGTLNILEACRSVKSPPPLLFTSTNKVYGNLSNITLQRRGPRYHPVDEIVRIRGVDERQPLDFHSPYGCSKGAADQYVLDYARCFGLPTVVFRMSCIYGPHQQGTEDQGWAAHFVKQILSGNPITIYGDGCQVRDMLFVDDLVRAMQLATEHISETRGRAFNIGGGPANAVSVREVVDRLAELDQTEPSVRYARWRPGDQHYYVSSTQQFGRTTGWAPKIDVRRGLSALYEWLREASFSNVAATRNEHGSRRIPDVRAQQAIPSA
jgi:CDP-paratose 2-epimerase